MEAIMACTCFSLGVRRRPADKVGLPDLPPQVPVASCSGGDANRNFCSQETQDAIATTSIRACEPPQSPEPPQMVPDQEDALSLASCSLSVVEPSVYQVTLLSNLHYSHGALWVSSHPPTVDHRAILGRASPAGMCDCI